MLEFWFDVFYLYGREFFWFLLQQSGWKHIDAMERSIPRVYTLLFRPVDKLLILVTPVQTKKARKSFVSLGRLLGRTFLTERKTF